MRKAPGILSLREAALWGSAALFMLGAHGLAAYALQTSPADMAMDAAEQALEIDLTPLPMTLPDAVASDATPQETVDDAIEPVEEVTEAVEEVVEPTESAEAEMVEPLEEPLETAALEPDTIEPIEDVQPEEVETQTVEPLIDEIEVPDVVTPEVVAMLPQPRPILEDKPKEKPAPKKPKRVEKKPERKEPTPKTAEAKPTPSEQNSRSSKASKAPSVSPARWQSRVLAWINRHKRYPRGAKSRGEEGMVQVSFAINASGSVISARIASSSGNPELDKAALEMVNRASPVPAPPPELASSRMKLSLPVQFNLR
ncbi:MAG: energy transducer TonB [Pseudaminobacter sp.]